MENNNNNNFNNNYYDMPQGRMFVQQPIKQQPPLKRKTGFIIGIIASISTLVIALTILFIILFAENDFVGTWRYVDKSNTITFTLDNDGNGLIYLTDKSNNYYEFEIIWDYNDDTQYLTITVLQNLKGERASTSYKVLNIDDNSMLVEYGNGTVGTFTKLD